MTARRTGPDQGLDTTARLEALARAVAALDPDDATAPTGRLPAVDDALTYARGVLRRASERRALSAEHTVVALAGATGGGKSSLANVILGSARMPVGARRPTTSAPGAGVLSASGEQGGAGPLLDWLDVPERHVVTSEDLDDLVLLDLPDVDSIHEAHQATVDRLAQVVDVLVWVLDPQKYADHLLHQRYLRPLATHAAVTVVVLNQVDTVAEAERPAVRADLDRLLAADGLGAVPVLVTSAVTGEGLDQLRRVLARTAAGRDAAEARLRADARAAALRLLEAVGGPAPAGLAPRDRDDLAVVLAEAAGVEVVAAAAARSYRTHARRTAGWPLTRWLARVPADPLRRLGLDRGVVDPALVRSSLSRPTAVQRARVEGAVRSLGVAASRGAAEPWRSSIRAAAAGSVAELADALDRAVVSTRLDSLRVPGWWRALGVLQWLLLACAAAGLLWLGALAAADYLGLPEAVPPRWGAVPWPTVLAAVGVIGGLVLAGIGGLLSRAGARRRAGKVRARLRVAVGRVADEVVLAPVDAEVRRCATFGAEAERAAAD